MREAYLQEVGAPLAFVWLFALVFAVGGAGLLFGFRSRASALILAGALVVVTLVIHSSYAPGGIGEYPPELNAEVNFKETAVHAAMIGALLLVLGHGSTRWSADKGVPGVERLLTSGRVIVGSYFVVNALWQWAYFDIRVEHIEASGGNPSTLPVVIALQLLGGASVAAGRWMKVSIPALMFILVVSTALVHGNLSATAPYPPNVQIHQWFVKAAILAGLLMIPLRQRVAARARAAKSAA